MSVAYDEYLTAHVENVKLGIIWLYYNIPYVRSLVPNRIDVMKLGYSHDNSKYEPAEYAAYDDYFYGEKSAEVRKAFDYAWLHHIHRNPHHWQYWVLIHDDEPIEALEMPETYVIEMIADWWSFSWKSNNLFSIFDWYETHSKGMILHPKTRELVEKILSLMEEELKNGEDR